VEGHRLDLVEGELGVAEGEVVGGGVLVGHLY
jgi:hypothetical protein